IGGTFAVFQETGAVESGISGLSDALARRPHLEGLVIPVLMTVFSLAGGIFGMAEEIIPFVIIFIPLARRLGYDSIVGISIPFLGAAAGFAAAFFNPFTVGIAQSIAGLPLYSGLAYRLVTWVVGTAVVITYVMLYARRIKRNPTLSPVYDLDCERGSLAETGVSPSWDGRKIAALVIFAACMLLLVIGGTFAVFQETGAVESGICGLTDFLARRPALEGLVIPVLMTAFSLAGGIFGMAEEIIPFVIIFIPLARRLGYDSIVGISIPFLGAAAGFAAAFFNPFTVGIAQSIAGLPLYSGLAYRLVTWVIGTTVVIAYVMLYARRIKRDPSLSPVRELDLSRGSLDETGVSAAWDARKVAALILFAFCMVLLVVGVLRWKWYMEEIAVLFFGMGIALGVAGRLGPSRIASLFVAGAKDMVGVVFIVACARALLIIAQDARIMDTMLFAASKAMAVLPRVVVAQVMFLIQSAINFLIHSGTAQAALTMPIMAPLADLVGVTRQTAVYAFQLCEFVNPILPTSAVTMGVLGAAKIPWDKWARWFLPLLVILILLSFLLLIPPVMLFHWGPA
ncbi:MAG: hypothetical protein NTW40_11080, partial [Acidobacteria bacterium]|nr:hypothetical protein [Acidobacteriota bacterium]